MSLDLARVLEFPDPISFLLFKACHLCLNLNSFLVFFVNATNEIQALLLALEGVFLGAKLLLLLFLATDHMLHSLRLQLIRFLLHVNHFLVLLTLLLQTVGFVGVALGLRLLVVLHSCALVVPLFSQALLCFRLFLRLLGAQDLLLCSSLFVSLAHLHDIDGLSLCLLDFFPCLLLF